MTRREVDFNTVIGIVLRCGVIASFILICMGSILLFVEGQTGYYALSSAGQLIQKNSGFLVGLVPLSQGIVSAKPYAIIELGLLILFATPIVRVFISVFLFMEERRYLFVLITITVLGLLLFSLFVVGPLVSG